MFQKGSIGGKEAILIQSYEKSSKMCTCVDYEDDYDP